MLEDYDDQCDRRRGLGLASAWLDEQPGQSWQDRWTASERFGERVRAGFDMGAMAAFWAMQSAFPELKKHGTGRVINIASLNGVNAHMYSVAYNMAKEALRTLTRTAAREWAQHQICCNIICPGAKSAAFERMEAASPENAAALASANPMGRMGDPLEDIGPVALFLGSDDCRYMTGNTLFVDGESHINGVQWSPNVD